MLFIELTFVSMDSYCQDLSNDVSYTTVHLVVYEKIKVSIKTRSYERVKLWVLFIELMFLSMDSHCQDLSNDVSYIHVHLVVYDKIKVLIKTRPY